MKRAHAKRAMALAGALLLAASAPVHGVLPIVAGLGKQLVQNLLIDSVKSQLMGSLSGMGCKGAALASVVGAAGGRAGLSGGLMPNLPGGVIPALPAGMVPGMPAGMVPGMPGGMVPSLPAGVAPGMPAGMARGATGMDSAQLAALMQQQMGARLPAGQSMTPEQAAQVSASMASLQQAMAQPLSRAETLAVFDELAELGVMTPAMHSEARDCVTLAPPGTGDALGASGALFKNMVLPQLRAAREQMTNLDPQQREQLASEIANAMKDAAPDDRKAFQDGLGQGFFPPDVLNAVREKLR